MLMGPSTVARCPSRADSALLPRGSRPCLPVASPFRHPAAQAGAPMALPEGKPTRIKHDVEFTAKCNEISDALGLDHVVNRRRRATPPRTLLPRCGRSTFVPRDITATCGV